MEEKKIGNLVYRENCSVSRSLTNITVLALFIDPFELLTRAEQKRPNCGWVKNVL